MGQEKDTPQIGMPHVGDGEPEAKILKKPSNRSNLHFGRELEGLIYAIEEDDAALTSEIAGEMVDGFVNYGLAQGRRALESFQRVVESYKERYRKANLLLHRMDRAIGKEESRGEGIIGFRRMSDYESLTTLLKLGDRLLDVAMIERAIRYDDELGIDIFAAEYIPAADLRAYLASSLTSQLPAAEVGSLEKLARQKELMVAARCLEAVSNKKEMAELIAEEHEHLQSASSVLIRIESRFRGIQEARENAQERRAVHGVGVYSVINNPEEGRRVRRDATLGYPAISMLEEPVVFSKAKVDDIRTQARTRANLNGSGGDIHGLAGQSENGTWLCSNDADPIAAAAIEGKILGSLAGADDLTAVTLDIITEDYAAEISARLEGSDLDIEPVQEHTAVIAPEPVKPKKQGRFKKFALAAVVAIGTAFGVNHMLSNDTSEDPSEDNQVSDMSADSPEDPIPMAPTETPPVAAEVEAEAEVEETSQVPAEAETMEFEESDVEFEVSEATDEQLNNQDALLHFLGITGAHGLFLAAPQDVERTLSDLTLIGIPNRSRGQGIYSFARELADLTGMEMDLVNEAIRTVQRIPGDARVIPYEELSRLRMEATLDGDTHLAFLLGLFQARINQYLSQDRDPHYPAHRTESAQSETEEQTQEPVQAEAAETFEIPEGLSFEKPKKGDKEIEETTSAQNSESISASSDRRRFDINFDWAPGQTAKYTAASGNQSRVIVLGPSMHEQGGLILKRVREDGTPYGSQFAVSSNRLCDSFGRLNEEVLSFDVTPDSLRERFRQGYMSSFLEAA